MNKLIMNKSFIKEIHHYKAIYLSLTIKILTVF